MFRHFPGRAGGALAPGLCFCNHTQEVLGRKGVALEMPQGWRRGKSEVGPGPSCDTAVLPASVPPAESLCPAVMAAIEQDPPLPASRPSDQPFPQIPSRLCSGVASWPASSEALLHLAPAPQTSSRPDFQTCKAAASPPLNPPNRGGGPCTLPPALAEKLVQRPALGCAGEQNRPGPVFICSRPGGCRGTTTVLETISDSDQHSDDSKATDVSRP